MSYDLSGVDSIDGTLKGEFTARVDEAKIKKSQKNEDMLVLKFAIVERKIHMTSRFMLQGAGAKIGMGKIKHLCELADLPLVISEDCSMWKGKMFTVYVGPQKDSPEYSEIKTFKKFESDTSFNTDEY